MTRITRIGQGTQGGDEASLGGLAERHLESGVVMTQDLWDFLQYWLRSGVPKSEWPEIVVRGYGSAGGRLMEAYPDGRVWGRELGHLVLEFIAWGWPIEKITCIQFANELALWNEHGGHDPSEPDFWPKQSFWESEPGWMAITDWSLQVIKGLDEVVPHIDVGVWAESFGHNEDGPHVNLATGGTGFYALQDDIYGRVLHHQRPGSGKLIFLLHTYSLFSTAGWRGDHEFWQGKRFARPVGFRDYTENKNDGDPGGLIHLIPPDMMIAITEINSPDNSARPLVYADDIVYIHDWLVREWGDRIIAIIIFLYRSWGIDHGEYTHKGTLANEKLLEWQLGLEPLSDWRTATLPPDAPPEEPDAPPALQYILGFKSYAKAHPDLVGEPVTNEYTIPIPEGKGWAIQHTTNGRLEYVSGGVVSFYPKA